MQLSHYLFHQKSIFYILLLCFLIRVVLVLSIDPIGNDSSDGLDYHFSAISVINGTGYPAHGALPFVRPPLYPLLLSVVYLFFSHETLLTARLVNVILDTTACFVFYHLILLIWNDRRTAIVSSLVYAVNPFYLFFNIRVRVEALFILLIVTGIYFLIKEYKKDFPALLTVALIGGVFGLACLCRSNGTALAALIPFWLIYCHLKKWKRGLLVAAVFILGCILIISPWSIRNYHKYGEFIAITDGFGYNFWISNTDLKLIDLRARTYQEYIDGDKILWQRANQIEKEIQEKSYKERDNHYTNLALVYIKNNFSTWVWLNILKFAEFWSPLARIDMQGTKALFTLPFGLLMYFGMFFYIRSFFANSVDRSICLLIAILIITATITGVMTWSSIRFRVPTVDAYVIPFGLFWLRNKFPKLFGLPDDNVT